ncbi:cyanophycinase [Gelidibacter japonicus]|uniref:cyanophycinase n=1 Tax=Gelidibacter japonicus TaxID=1962232 RepID=UPI0020212B66|nr:cyanophycinase [Gelidibacter japonicus]MCL8006883.1 cyanophycinase [Gelidibacter japonicus]
MMRLKGFLAICVFIGSMFCITPISAQEVQNKGKLVIIGGGSRPSAMIDRIIKESGIDKSGYGIILPMSSSEPDSAVYYASKQFIEKGLKNIYGLNFVKDELLTTSKVDSIKNAKMIYISGGDQNRFMDIVAGTDIEKAIHNSYSNGNLIAGTSAGAAVMSKMMITGAELKHPEYASTFRNIDADNIEIGTGLGMLTNVIIDQHFVKRSRYNRLISAVIEHPEMLGIGIDEATAILVSGSNAEVIGDSQVITLKNPKGSKNVHDDKLGAHGLQLNIYLPGEHFSLN